MMWYEYYYIFAGVGAVSGFIRAIRPGKKLVFRNVFYTAIFGALLSVATIGLWYGEKIADKIALCVAVAITFGFVQPEFKIILEQMLKGISNNGK